MLARLADHMQEVDREALKERLGRLETHRSTRQLEQAIRAYLDTYNSDPKPFAWTKSANDILSSIERFCLRISNSGH